MSERRVGLLGGLAALLMLLAIHLKPFAATLPALCPENSALCSKPT